VCLQRTRSLTDIFARIDLTADTAT